MTRNEEGIGRFPALIGVVIKNRSMPYNMLQIAFSQSTSQYSFWGDLLARHTPHGNFTHAATIDRKAIPIKDRGTGR